MYLTPAVRTIREDPIEGEPVTLLLEVAESTAMDDVTAAVEAAGASVDEELEFRTLRVTVVQERVAAVCDLDGVETVETANTLALDADGAGEDVRPEE